MKTATIVLGAFAFGVYVGFTYALSPVPFMIRENKKAAKKK